MRVIALSDLHIRSPEDASYGKLLRALEGVGPDDVLVLAGDVFDLWVGAKAIFMDRYRAFLQRLKSLDAQGTRIHYIEGNHDFHLAAVFREWKHLQVTEDEVVLERGGRRLFFAHGDQIDVRDYGYRALRFVFRSPLFEGFVRFAPDAWIEAIGQGSSSLSRAQHPSTLEDLPAAIRQRIRKLYRDFAAQKGREGFDYVILGHCHDLDERHFNVKGRPVQYLNMGFPPKHGSYLAWEVGEAKFQRIPFE